jgi:hypothetical protein
MPVEITSLIYPLSTTSNPLYLLSEKRNLLISSSTSKEESSLIKRGLIKMA